MFCIHELLQQLIDNLNKVTEIWYERQKFGYPIYDRNLSDHSTIFARWLQQLQNGRVILGSAVQTYLNKLMSKLYLIFCACWLWRGPPMACCSTLYTSRFVDHIRFFSMGPMVGDTTARALL